MTPIHSIVINVKLERQFLLDNTQLPVVIINLIDRYISAFTKSDVRAQQPIQVIHQEEQEYIRQNLPKYNQINEWLNHIIFHQETVEWYSFVLD